MCGPTLSLATKGILCCNGDIIRRIIYPLNTHLTNTQKFFHLILTNRKLNMKLNKSNSHIEIQELKIHTKNRSYKINIKDKCND